MERIVISETMDEVDAAVHSTGMPLSPNHKSELFDKLLYELICYDFPAFVALSTL